MKPNINSIEVHPQLSNNGHPVDGWCAGGCWFSVTMYIYIYIYIDIYLYISGYITGGYLSLVSKTRPTMVGDNIGRSGGG